MAITISHKAKKTKSGVFIRRDTNIGLLAHSPFTGLNYAVHSSCEKPVLRWLERRGSEAPGDDFKYSLGAGWAIDKEKARHFGPHLLPSPSAFSFLQVPDSPILINWFLTGRCPLACTYCYAEDLMRKDELEPTPEDIGEHAKSILELNPLVVVLTGGDPLFSPYLSQAIHLLYGKVGIVLDTSGFTFTGNHLSLFREYGVSVRISFDSERPAVNQRQRPLYFKYPQLAKKGISTAEAAVKAMCQCLDAGVSVTVQTVATKKTANDLVALGDKLYRLGVRSWRIFKVAPSEARLDGYLKLVGTHTDSGKRIIGKQALGPYDFAFNAVRVAAENNWDQKMAIQIAGGEVRNAVILVSPDGKFYTESNVSLGKVLLDERRPTSPSIKAVRAKVNMQAHMDRYLNLTR
jgi:MoaA/NifB/PqqE/SkfB family radical SAM enzyme